VLFVGKVLVCIFVCYCASLDHFGFVLLVLLGLVSPVLSQEIGWEDLLRNDLFCVEWGVKSCSINLIEIVIGMQTQTGPRNHVLAWIQLK